MSSASNGTLAELPSKHIEDGDFRAGFTLVEALVALSLLVAFAGSLGSLMFQSRGILTHGSGEVRAELLLRSLLQTPFPRTLPAIGYREGESGGLLWRVDVEPATEELFPSGTVSLAATKDEELSWALFHVTAEVSWGAGKMVKADTLQLGAVN